MFFERLFIVKASTKFLRALLAMGPSRKRLITGNVRPLPVRDSTSPDSITTAFNCLIKASRALIDAALTP